MRLWRGLWPLRSGVLFKALLNQQRKGEGKSQKANPKVMARNYYRLSITLRRNSSFSNGVTFSVQLLFQTGTGILHWHCWLMVHVVHNPRYISRSRGPFHQTGPPLSRHSLNCRQTASLSAVLQSMNADFCLAYPFARVRALKTAMEHKRARDRERL